ncbi:MAG: DUF1559 domain-containing protein [Fimbriiglobus sp.]
MIGIVVIVLGLLLPKVRRVREAASRAQCQNNFKQILLGMQSYADEHHAAYGPGCFGAAGQEPEMRLSWQVPLLPFVEQDEVFRSFDPECGYTPEVASRLKRLKVYSCPSFSLDTPVTNYVAMAGLGADAPLRPLGQPGNGLMGYDRATPPKKITDGTANTIAIAETHSALGPYAQGGTATLRVFDPSTPNLFAADGAFGSPHDKRFLVGICDGSVRVLKFDQNPQVFADMVTIAGGEPNSLD